MKITRRLLQLAFLVLTVVAVFVVRGDAERWCPFGGVEALYSYVTQGSLTCSLGVSNFFILGAVLTMTLLLRRVFCSYACPIGTISEWLLVGAQKVGWRGWRVPYRWDRILSLLEYPVLAVILYITYKSGELLFRGFDPCYVLISRHGKDITFWSYVVAGGIVLGSLLVMLPFCRWLCPLAAVLNPFSRVGLTAVRRHADSCIDCGVCTRVCPMGIQVDKAHTVTAARCTACLDCVEACPKTTNGAMTWGPPKALGRHWPQAALIVIMLACIGGAVAATYAFPLPSFVAAEGDAPATTKALDLQVRGVTCRGSSTGLVQILGRDDGLGVEGYLKVETWPGADLARVRITYDPSVTTAATIKQAITEPFYDFADDAWTPSPYEIDGYDPLAAEE